MSLTLGPNGSALWCRARGLAAELGDQVAVIYDIDGDGIRVMFAAADPKEKKA